jgi:hypothetical protein
VIGSTPGDWLHHSLDDLGLSLVAPIGFVADDMGDDAVILWDGDDDDDERADGDATFEMRRTGMGAGAALEVALHRLGRAGAWTGDCRVVVDGVGVAGREFSSDGAGGPMRGFIAHVDGPFPLIVRAEWPRGDDRFDQMLTMASHVRLTSGLDPFELPGGRRSSITSTSLLLSVAVPGDHDVLDHESTIALRGPGTNWVLRRAEQDLEVVSEPGDAGVASDTTTGVGTLAASVAAGGNRYRVHAEGDDLDLLGAITSSLRYHQFLATI